MTQTAWATAALLAVVALHGHAQPIQPIYLQYDGFVRNKDNHTITLSFGYYNMNHVDVRDCSRRRQRISCRVPPIGISR